jgi:hypothetical protein
MSEQERADHLAREIDRLMAGERITGSDPLLEVASFLANILLLPSAQARARFEARLDQWFKPSTPSTPVARPFPQSMVVVVVMIAIILIAIILGTAISNRIAVMSPTATPAASSTAATSPTSPLNPSATITPTRGSSVAPLTQLTSTLSPTPSFTSATAILTPVSFSRLIISGPVERIQGTVLIVFGQSIQIEGSIVGLCVGDILRIEAVGRADGTFVANRTAVTIEASACPPIRRGEDDD